MCSCNPSSCDRSVQESSCFQRLFLAWMPRYQGLLIIEWAPLLYVGLNGDHWLRSTDSPNISRSSPSTISLAFAVTTERKHKAKKGLRHGGVHGKYVGNDRRRRGERQAVSIVITFYSLHSRSRAREEHRSTRVLGVQGEARGPCFPWTRQCSGSADSAAPHRVHSCARGDDHRRQATCSSRRQHHRGALYTLLRCRRDGCSRTASGGPAGHWQGVSSAAALQGRRPSLSLLVAAVGSRWAGSGACRRRSGG